MDMNDGLRLDERVRSSGDEVFISALEAVDSAIRVFGPEGLVVAFNGGKDATVVLHLIRASLARYCADVGSDSTNVSVKAMFLQDPHEFPEVTEFVQKEALRCRLSLLTHSLGYVDGLREVLQVLPNTRAFVLGTRVGDPHADQLDGVFTPSTAPYPPFIRVCPILRWKYRDVWRFIRGFEIPYCCLYNQGYTSLGNRLDTSPNPALATKDPERPFLPPWALVHGDLEREGRRKKEANDVVSDEKFGMLEIREAAMIVIGNEILQGGMADMNVRPTAVALRRCGVRLSFVAMVPDNVNHIAEVVRDLSNRFEVVVTSGGIGPTHDDVTMKSLAQAFGEPLRRDAEYEKRIRAHYETEGTFHDKYVTMADIPQISRLVFHKDAVSESQTSGFPIVKTGNVYSLPGIPTYYLRGLDLLETRLKKDVSFLTRKVYLAVPEIEVAELAESLSSKFGESISIGCYPFVDRDDCRAIVAFEGQSRDEIGQACGEFLARLPENVVVGLEDDMDLRSPAHPHVRTPADEWATHDKLLNETLGNKLPTHTTDADATTNTIETANIRRATLEDISDIVNFNMSLVFETEGRTLNGEVLRGGVEGIVSDRSKGHYYVVESRTSGRLACMMVTFEWSDWRNSTIWWIQSVYVRPEFRRKGLFRAMYSHVRQEAVSAGSCGIRLYTHRQNQRAMTTYETLGMSSQYVVYEDIF